MSKSRVVLKSPIKSKLLTWIRSTLGGSMGTRHCRLSWELIKEDVPRLKLQIKIAPESRSESLNQILTASCSPVSPEKFYVFQKTDINVDESKWMLKELLQTVWGSFTSGESHFNSSQGFLRCNPDIVKENIIVEYGSPNIAKPLHMGHLRSTVTGHYVARICKAAGQDVTSICFLGDWGTQFGILQAGLKKFLQNDQSTASTVHALSLSELLQIYVKAVQEKEKDDIFFRDALACSAALESGETEAIEVWKSIREKTIDHLTSFWNTFGIHYDVVQGESEFAVQSKHTDGALNLLKTANNLEIGDDQRTLVVLPADERFSKPMKVPLVKSDGSSLYLLRDIACCLARSEKFNFSRMLYVVDKTQVHHFTALFRIMELLKIQNDTSLEDEWEKKLIHVTFGKVAGMSTRSGNFVLLSDVVEFGASLMQQNRAKSPNTRNADNFDIATKLAISALVVNSLKTRRNRDINFDWNAALNPTGETGVSLQYTYARLSSLKAKLASMFPESDAQTNSPNFSITYVMNDPIALNLAIHLVNFEDAFWSSYSELEPCILLTYLFKLSDKVSKALKELKVQSEPDIQLATTRYLLFDLSRNVLGAGLHIIGLQPLEEM